MFCHALSFIITLNFYRFSFFFTEKIHSTKNELLAIHKKLIHQISFIQSIIITMDRFQLSLIRQFCRDRHVFIIWWKISWLNGLLCFLILFYILISFVYVKIVIHDQMAYRGRPSSLQPTLDLLKGINIFSSVIKLGGAT